MAADAALPLAGRLAFVAGGAGRGVGRAAVWALARDGADVVVDTDRSIDAAEALAEEVRALGRRAMAVQAHIGRPEAVEAAAVRVRETLGEPDILVVSAGAKWRPRDIVEIPPEDWREALSEEVDAPYLLLRQFLPAMRRRRWGRIVLLGGFDAERWHHPPEVAPLDYGLGKAARHWLVDVLARQEAPHGVTVNGVAPGPIARVPLEAIRGVVLGEQSLEGADGSPTQVEVAETVAWLCRNGRVTGTVVRMPGPEPGRV